MNTLEGRAAIVTGAGRSRGIGRAAARELAKRGAAVVVTDLARRVEETDMFGITTVAQDMSGLEEAVAEITGSGGRALAMSCDVTNGDEVRSTVDRTLDEFGSVDIVFNNAGTPVGAKPFFELTDRDWQLSWDVNVMGMVNFSRAVVPSMREQGSGSIINNSSLAGVRGYDSFAGYNATKFAVIGLTKALAMEFGPDGIRVNAVCPGDIDTQMADIAIELSETTGMDYGQEMPDWYALRRRGSADEVGRVVAWLASDESSYVTGEEIRIDGGHFRGL